MPCTCPWHSAHPYSADTRSFAWHTPSVDVAHTLRRRSLKLPHDQRPACKTHANSISTGSPMQLRTNRRGHSPAPSSVNPAKLGINRRPHAPTPSSGSPVKLRTNRRALPAQKPLHLHHPEHTSATRSSCMMRKFIWQPGVRTGNLDWQSHSHIHIPVCSWPWAFGSGAWVGNVGAWPKHAGTNMQAHVLAGFAQPTFSLCRRPRTLKSTQSLL